MSHLSLRSSPWRNPGYVCHSCLRKLARSSSTASVPTTSPSSTHVTTHDPETTRGQQYQPLITKHAGTGLRERLARSTDNSRANAGYIRKFPARLSDQQTAPKAAASDAAREFRLKKIASTSPDRPARSDLSDRDTTAKDGSQTTAIGTHKRRPVGGAGGRVTDKMAEQQQQQSQTSHRSPSQAHKPPSTSASKPQGRQRSSGVKQPTPKTQKRTTQQKTVRAKRSQTGPTDKGAVDVFSVDTGALRVEPLDVEQPAVPRLAHGLDRALFNPGVTLLQDTHSGVYNFDPYVESIMPVTEFNFKALKPYKTSSEDGTLTDMAKKYGKKYFGSTSSMTGALARLHMFLSQMRNVNTSMLSSEFPVDGKGLTKINRQPYSFFLRWNEGAYAIDADKRHDSPNVLMMLGKSMEKLLINNKDDMERYRKSDPRGVPPEESEEAEAFQYTTMGDFLMRSQLDAYDPRLPGSGMFDLKTRAVLPIRHFADRYDDMLGYELREARGEFESYEREYFDMMRSTMLKYMLQARMGRMDGIFVAYHNIERIFGFQYVPMADMDLALHGQRDRSLGDREFSLSLHILNHLLNMATEKFPKQSLRLLIHAHGSQEESDVPSTLSFFAEPQTEEEIDAIQLPKKKTMADYEDRVAQGMSNEDALNDFVQASARELNDDIDEADPLEAAARTVLGGPIELADQQAAIREIEEEMDIEEEEEEEAEEEEQQQQQDLIAGGAEEDMLDMLGPGRATAVEHKPALPAVSSVQSSDSSKVKPEQAAATPTKPLFAVSLLVEHTVGEHQLVRRPIMLSSNETWKARYAVKHLDPAVAWKEYRKVTKAQAKIMVSARSRATSESGYKSLLQRLSRDGREYREALEKSRENTDPVVWSSSS